MFKIYQYSKAKKYEQITFWKAFEEKKDLSNECFSNLMNNQVLKRKNMKKIPQV